MEVKDHALLFQFYDMCSGVRREIVTGCWLPQIPISFTSECAVGFFEFSTDPSRKAGKGFSIEYWGEGNLQ